MTNLQKLTAIIAEAVPGIKEDPWSKPRPITIQDYLLAMRRKGIKGDFSFDGDTLLIRVYCFQHDIVARWELEKYLNDHSTETINNLLEILQ